VCAGCWYQANALVNMTTHVTKNMAAHLLLVLDAALIMYCWWCEQQDVGDASLTRSSHHGLKVGAVL
jgi:hypothetical protein